VDHCTLDTTSLEMGDSAPSQRTKVKRAAQRAIYDKDHVYTILDEGLVAHVGIVQDGLPVVIPMGYARMGNDLLLHGSISSRLMKVGFCTSPVLSNASCAKACWVRTLVLGDPHRNLTVAGNEGRNRCVRDRDCAGWACASPITFSSLHELPIGSCLWTPSGNIGGTKRCRLLAIGRAIITSCSIIGNYCELRQSYHYVNNLHARVLSCSVFDPQQVC